MDGWMDNLQVYAHFNSVSDISGPWLDDNERLSIMESSLRLKRFPSPVGLDPGTAISAG